MQNINHQKSPHIPVPFTQTYSFGTRYLFCSSLKPFYQDSSLQTKTLHLQKTRQRYRKLLSAKIVTQKTLLTLSCKLESISENKFLNSLTQEHLHLLGLQHQVMHEAATKIQALVRGHLTRKAHEEKRIKITKAGLNFIIKSLIETQEHCLWNVGAIAHKAATKLQQFFRRVMFRIKIQRISRTYFEYLEQIRAPIYYYLSKVIGSFVCAKMVRSFKRNAIRQGKLLEIRKRLAILAIKKILKKKRITVRSLRARIRRYKRLSRHSFQMPQTRIIEESITDKKRSSLKPLNLEFVEFPSEFAHRVNTINSLQNSPVLTHEVSFLSPNANTDSIKPMPTLEIKSHTNPSNRESRKSLVSHNFFQSIKESRIVPILYHNELETQPVHHFTNTNASVSRMLATNPSRSPPKPLKTLRSRVQSAVSSKSRSPPTLNYLNQTISSCQQRVCKKPLRKSLPSTFSKPQYPVKDMKPALESRIRKRFRKTPKKSRFAIRVKANRTEVTSPSGFISVKMRITSAPLQRRASEVICKNIVFGEATPQYFDV